MQEKQYLDSCSPPRLSTVQGLSAKFGTPCYLPPSQCGTKGDQLARSKLGIADPGHILQVYRLSNCSDYKQVQVPFKKKSSKPKDLDNCVYAQGYEYYVKL